MAFVKVFAIVVGVVLAASSDCAHGSTETCAELGSSMFQRETVTHSGVHENKGLSHPQPPPTRCTDTDNGATNKEGSSCASNLQGCASTFDTDDFKVYEMCCLCSEWGVVQGYSDVSLPTGGYTKTYAEWDDEMEEWFKAEDERKRKARASKKTIRERESDRQREIEEACQYEKTMLKGAGEEIAALTKKVNKLDQMLNGKSSEKDASLLLEIDGETPKEKSSKGASIGCADLENLMRTKNKQIVELTDKIKKLDQELYGPSKQ